MLLHALLILTAYLIGSLSAAIILCRLLGLPDPRTQGSGNPGATNMLRIGGKKAAAATLFLDMLKGLLPVLLARALDAPLEIQAAVAFAAFLGHLYPVFFRFQGGKGVATALGVLLALNWLVGLATIATWLVMALLFRISSLAALTAILLTPLYFWLLDRQPPLLAVALVITLLLFWRHRSNIRKLLDGTEGRISLGSKGGGNHQA
jgi:acyl phosphate:glycerol-3-phosphate acyltransferase